MNPSPGDKRWSNYFNDWVVLAHFVSDREWYFWLSGDPNRGQAQAKTPWSLMPLGPT